MLEVCTDTWINGLLVWVASISKRLVLQAIHISNICLKNICTNPELVTTWASMLDPSVFSVHAMYISKTRKKARETMAPLKGGWI